MNRQKMIFCAIACLMVMGLMTFQPSNGGPSEVPVLIAQELVGGAACAWYELSDCPYGGAGNGSDTCPPMVCMRAVGPDEGNYLELSKKFSCGCNTTCGGGEYWNGLVATCGSWTT